MSVLDWLFESEPYVQYAVRLNILMEKKEDLKDLRKAVLNDCRIRDYLNDIADFNKILVTNHKNPDLPIHKLIFLLDVGLDTDVPEISMGIRKIMKNIDENGMYRSITNVPKHFGGTGENTLAWALCDAPLMLYALLRSGVDYEKHIRRGVEHILELHRDNGFPCVVSKELGKFRGPGRKDDCCPYATLIILKLLSQIPEYVESKIVINDIDIILELWEDSRIRHPYMFFMGTDFRKLKAPTLWYDLVSVADCLSRFAAARSDGRFGDMLDVIQEKGDIDGRFIPESIYLKCKDWDFGQKKKPSPWLTYLCLRILERTGRFRFQ